jgi:flavin reductase (DIM6/NTAB) family NADH-FMN oxidoreductase RutF
MKTKKEIKPYRPVYPSPAALITSVDAKGRANIITLGEVFNISIREPVILGIAIRPATYSHGLISGTKEFAVNLPTVDMLEKVDRCGMVSGRSGKDKFREIGLTPVPSTRIRPPCIEECPVNIECEVMDILRVGDHDLFLGNVVAMRVDEDKLDEKGDMLNETLDPIVYITGQYWSIGRPMGALYFSVEKNREGGVEQ